MNYIQGHKYLWKMPSVEQQYITNIAASYNLSFSIAQTLLNRGFVTKNMIDSFLFSTLEHDVAHTSLMKDAIKAIDRIIKAIDKKEKILIFGDYDVDGITSSALMMICLLPLGAQVNFFLPHRVHDGYGLSSRIIDRAGRNGYKVIITVDNGITAYEPIEHAKKYGIDVIITDHHSPHGHVPNAYAIVNPNQYDCPYPFKGLAGVGVTFKVLSLLYEYKKLALPAKAYELLLLGTIADVVPLLGENRYWVRYGIHQVNTCLSVSFNVLKNNSKITKTRVSAIDIGFSITPQINALGRLEDPRQAVSFLIGSDVKNVERIGMILFELNQARKEIERSVLADVERDIQSKKIDLDTERIILAISDNWPPGVIGLVAARLVAAYNRPTILLHKTDGGLAKGSCRSISEFNIFDALQGAADILEQFGGHSVAAGLSLKYENIEKLKEKLEKIAANQLKPDDLKHKLVVDAEIKLSDLTSKFLADMNHLEPFGSGNPQPIFFVHDVTLVQKPVLLKEMHIKCSIFADGVIKPVIFFNKPELFDVLTNMKEGESFTLAAYVQENHWNNRVNIELQGIDIARV